ncbi:hypothetical protein LshimejAT787_0106260 [Lyophyllum shimeji]|uniref:RRM domain-containing protein n=1 Tax=Lyophyllum shimeji TaxID=47721 RepID=A0A9P3PD99_LYOSH|nr:hypothetical protein LshimejAT787_0106260 [Lyophyllum shimeji]
MRVAWNQSPDTAKGPADAAPQGGRRSSNARTRANPPTQRKRASISQQKREEKLHAVQEAKKRNTVKTGTDKSQVKVRRTFPFVYVGNLKPSITEERLRALFAPCGPIFRIGIRCSRGQAVTVGVPVPENVLTPRDRQYASIEFHDLEAAKLALRLNGAIVDGLQIVVSTTPADLPEVQDIVQTRIAQKQGNNGLLEHFRRKLRSQPVPAEATEQFNPQDRHRIFGFSFAKCLA